MGTTANKITLENTTKNQNSARQPHAPHRNPQQQKKHTATRSNPKDPIYRKTRIKKRARWDLNPRSPAPKADTLIRARLRAHPKQNNNGPVAQHGWSVRLIIERSPVQIRLGPPPNIL